MYLTAEASAKCEKEGRKAVSGEDILWSISQLGFHRYSEPMRVFHHRHHIIESGERQQKRRLEQERLEEAERYPKVIKTNSTRSTESFH